MVHRKSVADCSHVFGTRLQQLGSFDVVLVQLCIAFGSVPGRRKAWTTFAN